jgi:hypothetical protein
MYYFEIILNLVEASTASKEIMRLVEYLNVIDELCDLFYLDWLLFRSRQAQLVEVA